MAVLTYWLDNYYIKHENSYQTISTVKVISPAISLLKMEIRRIVQLSRGFFIVIRKAFKKATCATKKYLKLRQFQFI